MRILHSFSKAGVEPATSNETPSSSVLPDSMFTPSQQQGVNLSTERISSTTSHAGSPIASSNTAVPVPSNGQPSPAHMRMQTNLANGHHQASMMNPSTSAVYQSREASFGNMPNAPQLANPLVFDNVPNLLPGASNQIMVGQADSSSQMFLQGQPQHQQMDGLMGGNNKNLPQEVMLNLMKEYGNPEQIGSLFDQQMADPFNIQMSLPLLDYFD